MKKISVNFENCYGIKKLEHEFDLSKNSCSLIYASNGVMKTSFTKTFKALSNGKKPTDEVFKHTTVLNKVMLMTSENIHVNSFMFEPIIDMSTKSLVDIYSKLNVFVSEA